MIYPEPKHFANTYVIRSISHYQDTYFSYVGNPIPAVNS